MRNVYVLLGVTIGGNPVSGVGSIVNKDISLSLVTVSEPCKLLIVFIDRFI